MNKKLPYEVVDRRPGHVGSCYANVTKVKQVLHWTADKSIKDARQDAWNWQSQHPNGYPKSTN